MKKFKVFANGVKTGIFEAEDENAALEAYAQEAGYESVADMDEQLNPEAEYDVVEVTASEEKQKEEMKMKKFKVVINRLDLGIFEAKDEADALEVYAQEAGYQSLADMEEQLESKSEYKVVEV